MSSTYGEHLKLSLFGQSHGAAIGMTLDGIPAGLPVDLEQLQQFLQRRAPGQNDFSTPRREEDRPEFLSGLLDGYTCGAPIAAIIRNNNTRSGDYSNLKDCPGRGTRTTPPRSNMAVTRTAPAAAIFPDALLPPCVLRVDCASNGWKRRVFALAHTLPPLKEQKIRPLTR